MGYGKDGAKNIKEHPYFSDIDWEEAWEKKLTPPLIPKLKDETDLSYFDKMFTDEKIEGSNVSEVPSTMMSQTNDYKGFTYVTNSVTTELMDMRKVEENN